MFHKLELFILYCTVCEIQTIILKNKFFKRYWNYVVSNMNFENFCKKCLHLEHCMGYTFLINELHHWIGFSKDLLSITRHVIGFLQRKEEMYENNVIFSYVCRKNFFCNKDDFEDSCDKFGHCPVSPSGSGTWSRSSILSIAQCWHC